VIPKLYEAVSQVIFLVGRVLGPNFVGVSFPAKFQSFLNCKRLVLGINTGGDAVVGLYRSRVAHRELLWFNVASNHHLNYIVLERYKDLWLIEFWHLKFDQHFIGFFQVTFDLAQKSHYPFDQTVFRLRLIFQPLYPVVQNGDDNFILLND